VTTPTPETAEQRIARLVLEVQSGQRDLNSIRQSVDRLAGREPGDYSAVDDSAWLGDPARLAQRVRDIFTNRGVPLERGASPAPQIAPPPPPPSSPPRPAGPSPAPAFDPEADARDRQRRDAFARLNATLDDYGLGSLGKTVQAWLIEGLSEAEIVQRMRDTKEFKTRFAGIEARRKAGLPAISPGEYVAYERNAAQLMRAAGLPQGFYDSPEDFTNLLTKDVSIAELGDRVTLAANAAFKMPKEDRDALAAWGLGPGDLTAFWLNPDKAQPLLERKYAAAQLAGSARRTSWGILDESNATRLAGLGVTAPQAEEGFGKLVESRELFTALDRGEDKIGRKEQLSAAFEGNAKAQRRIEQRARRRAAAFQGGGGFAATQQGLVGLGDAQ
jgi:hypothetical protein